MIRSTWYVIYRWQKYYERMLKYVLGKLWGLKIRAWYQGKGKAIVVRPQAAKRGYERLNGAQACPY